jgi:hypothetical protein
MEKEYLISEKSLKTLIELAFYEGAIYARTDNTKTIDECKQYREACFQNTNNKVLALINTGN